MKQREVADEMLERCGYVFEIEGLPERPADREEGSGNVFGATMTGRDGKFLAVEVGVGLDGLPFMSLRAFDADGEPSVPSMIASAEHVMVIP